MDVKRNKTSNRRLIVFLCLIGTLTLTSALLLALAPAPLGPEQATSLFALDDPASFDPIFKTQIPPATGRWKYIYIHHSNTLSGNASTPIHGHLLDEHFVIGNGDGTVDGEIQMTQNWDHQQSVNHPPAGATQIDPACISICLIGNFDQTRPTATQIRRLIQLVAVLQTRLHIPSHRVWMLDAPASTAGIGTHFPAADFMNQLIQ